MPSAVVLAFVKLGRVAGRSKQFLNASRQGGILRIKACDSDVILIALQLAYGQILDRGSRSVGKMSEWTAL